MVFPCASEEVTGAVSLSDFSGTEVARRDVNEARRQTRLSAGKQPDEAYSPLSTTLSWLLSGTCDFGIWVGWRDEGGNSNRRKEKEKYLYERG